MTYRMITRGFLMGSGSLIAVLVSFWCPALADELVGPVPLVHISQTLASVKSRERQVIPVQLAGTVYGVDKIHHGLVLGDQTGWLWLETETLPDGLEAGQTVRVDGPVVFGRDHAILGGAVLVEHKASGGADWSVVRLYLHTGKHPFDLDFFNATQMKCSLEINWAGPGFSRTNLPDSILCHPNLKVAGQFLPGVQLEVYKYDAAGRWDEFPDFSRLKPISVGVTNHFVAASADDAGCVSLHYSGCLDIAKDGNYEFILRAGDGARFSLAPETPGRIEVVGTGPIDPPRGVAPGQDWDFLTDPAWVQTEGTVRQAGFYDGKLQLELATETGRLPAFVSDGEAPAAAMLLGSKVKTTGLGWSASTHRGGKIAGMLLAPSLAEVAIIQAPPDRWQSHPLCSIGALKGSGPTNAMDSLVHLRGSVTGVVPGRALRVRDATGEIEARTILAQASDQGLEVELLGQPVRENGRDVLLFAAMRRGPDFADPDRELPLLSSTEQIRRLTMAEATRHYPARFKGIVTFVFYGGLQAHVQGETEGITVVAKSSGALAVTAGDFCEFAGVTAKGLMSPTVDCKHYTVLGHGLWPEPMRPTWRQLNNGSLDAQWVEVQGVVLSDKSLNLVLGLYGGEITARIYQADPAELKHLVNAVVRVRGSVTLANSRKHRVENISVEVNSRFDITVDLPPPADIFAVPAEPVASLYAFDPSMASVRPVEIHGQILHSRRNILYLTDGGNGLRIIPRQRVDLAPGDQVEVFGLPDNDGALPMLRQALLQKTGLAPLPPPREFIGDLKDSTWVRLEGIVVSRDRNPTNQVLEIQAGETAVAVELDPESGRLPEVPLQSSVRVTGVYLAPTPASSRAGTISEEILLNSPADLVVLARPSWWTLRHSLLMLLGMSLALAGAFVWITALRRRVEEHTRALRAEIEERRRAQLEVEQTHRQLVDASRRAGQAEVAANVLHNVGNVLNSVNVSASLLTDHLRAMSVESVSRAAELMREHETDLPRFLSADEKGRHLPGFLAQLGRHLHREQTRSLDELGELRQNVELINGIVAMQQAYAGRFGTMETLAITELVESALRLQANTYEHRSIDIARDFATVPAVLTDKHSVLVILVNLLQNAQQACEAGRPLRKQITIRIQRAGDAAVSITVADNGVGIAPENMVRIFEHGFTTRNDGHGFGLHSGALAAREIGGQLTVHSDGLGTGAAFTLTLPLRPPPKSESGNPPASPAPDVSSGE